jgi:hypothetical protein
MNKHNIESRPVWELMHLHPVFDSSRKDAKNQNGKNG